MLTPGVRIQPVELGRQIHTVHRQSHLSSRFVSFSTKQNRENYPREILFQPESLTKSDPLIGRYRRYRYIIWPELGWNCSFRNIWEKHVRYDLTRSETYGRYLQVGYVKIPLWFGQSYCILYVDWMYIYIYYIYSNFWTTSPKPEVCLKYSQTCPWNPKQCPTSDHVPDVKDHPTDKWCVTMPYGSMAVWEGTAKPPSYSQLYPGPTFFWEGTWWIHRDSSLIFCMT